MKTPEHERLLRDVLSTPDYTAFRAELAEQLRGQLGQRRGHWDTRYLALAASLAFLAAIFWSGTRPSGRGDSVRVRSHPLPATEVVRTGAQPIDRVRTTGFGERIETASAARPVNVLTDDELLAMFPGKPLALVSDNSGHRQLLFLDPNGPQIFLPGTRRDESVQ